MIEEKRQEVNETLIHEALALCKEREEIYGVGKDRDWHMSYYHHLWIERAQILHELWKKSPESAVDYITRIILPDCPELQRYA